jgi:hypothetical protein
MNFCSSKWLVGGGIYGVGLTLFNSWVIFEETIIDRKGYGSFLPGYRVGDPCVWDASIAIVLVSSCTWLWMRLIRNENYK